MADAWSFWGLPRRNAGQVDRTLSVQETTSPDVAQQEGTDLMEMDPKIGTDNEPVTNVTSQAIQPSNVEALPFTTEDTSMSMEERVIVEDAVQVDSPVMDIQPANVVPDNSPDAQLAAMINAQEDAGYDSGNDQDQPPERFECVCGEHVGGETEVMFLNCGHVRCRECLNNNIRVGLSSRANFPPRCCVPFDLGDISAYINDDLLDRWFAVSPEYSDVSPVYCGKKECSAYLCREQLIEGGRWANCTTCNIKTCTGCGGLETEHRPGDQQCPERMEKMDRDLMKDKGWKRCPQCRHMIERIDGCNSMMCECGKEFCYGCGREYVGGLPCNCEGQNQWVEEDPDGNNHEAQREMLEEIEANRARDVADNPPEANPAQ